LILRTRGRKPKPTHLKLVKGTGRKATINRNEAVPPPGRPDVPDHLDDIAKVEWGRVCDDLYNSGLLSKVDRMILAAYCQAYARWVLAERTLKEMAKRDELTSGLMIKTISGNAIQNPIVGVANKAMADAARYATDLGMTPSSRSRVTARPPGPGKEDPADKYFG
jgi:P27 family predicted phage terminase small subunit